jgi:hypothetical protein
VLRRQLLGELGVLDSLNADASAALTSADSHRSAESDIQ